MAKSEAAIDKDKIEVWSDEYLCLDVDEAEELAVELISAIETAKKRKRPPLDPPLFIDKEKHKLMPEDYEEPRAGTGEGVHCLIRAIQSKKDFDEFPESGCVALMGYEMDLEEIEALHKWLGRAVKYYRGKK